MAYHRNPVYDDAYNLYKSGLSLAEVAKSIGVTRQCVYKAFAKRNFILRAVNLQLEQWYDGKKFTLRNHGYFELTSGDRMLLHRYIWEKERGPIPERWDVHHINEDKTDNSIENFECLPKADHTRKHAVKRRLKCK